MICMRRIRWNPRVIAVGALAAWQILVTSIVTIGVWNNPIHRAVLGMGWGLLLLWVAVCGLSMLYWRERLNQLAARLPIPWGLKFVLGCTLLALLEEAITTTLTNSAPLFGVAVGEAYITASASYLDVVLYHSVVVFVPMFIAWALLLRWWRFSPFAVFLLFGITGTLAETLTFGSQNLANFAFWILVYGLMVWLPAHWPPRDRPARPPRWWSYPVAVFLPFLFVPLVAVLAPWLWLTAKHPDIHFPPIGG